MLLSTNDDHRWKLLGWGSASLLTLLYLRHLAKQPWAPAAAEWKILQTLWHEGLLKVFFPTPEDGTSELSLIQRLRRVQELRSMLGLERFHQIDVARRNVLGTDGWGKTTGTHHLQHLPSLVFRGDDQQLANDALRRSQRLFANPEALKLQEEWERTPIIKDLVLVGGGHSHVHVLRMLGMEPMPGVRVTMVTRDVETPYSGMLPGHIAGMYTRRECHLDLNILARFARVRLIHATVEAIDVKQKQVLLSGDRPPIGYDVLSINIGSAPKVQCDAHATASGHNVTPVKPIDGFGARWDSLLERLPDWKGGTEPRRVLVVGGGAGGFELAMTMHARLTKELQRLGSATVKVALVTRSGLLPQHTVGARALAAKALRDKGIELYSGYEVSHADAGQLHCKDGRTLSYDECIWCTQGSPQSWVSSSGLRTDQDGFLLVDQQMRCHTLEQADDAPIFAGGDIASIDGHPRPKAGVFAVMAGMTLWLNLRATLRGEKLVTYWPQVSFLGLLNLGDGSCIASKGPLATHGQWLWELKDWIDRRWMWNYSEGLPEMPTVSGGAAPGGAVALAAGQRATALLRQTAMRCGGCGAKVGATTLTQAMRRVESFIPKQPLSKKAEVMLGAGDDAAVVDFLDAGRRISTVQTIDFFRSFIDDPFVFGQVAAFHALSDVEAMGAEPSTALALVQIPYALEEKQEEDLVQLMAGASVALKSVGCALVGGHTCEAKELGLGFSVCGTMDSSVMKKSLMKPGDLLILTKPLGTGALFAADMRAKARGPWIQQALRSMATSNGRAAKILHSKGSVACTDVTGFGLIGHLFEMCSQSEMQVRIQLQKVPFYQGAIDCVEMGIESSLQVSNVRLRRAVTSEDQVRSHPAYPLLFDPQTAGGLLAAVPKDDAEQCVAELRASGATFAAIIGSVPALGGWQIPQSLVLRFDVTGCAEEALDFALKTFACGLFPDRSGCDPVEQKDGDFGWQCVATPTEIPGAPGFTSLAAGEDGCLGITPEGDVHRWVATGNSGTITRGFAMEWTLSVLKDEANQRLQLRDIALGYRSQSPARSRGRLVAVALMDSGDVFASQAWYDDGGDGREGHLPMSCPEWHPLNSTTFLHPPLAQKII
eukprot:s1777_g16.t1